MTRRAARSRMNLTVATMPIANERKKTVIRDDEKKTFVQMMANAQR